MSSRKVKPDNCKCLSCRAWRRIGRAKKRMAQVQSYKSRNGLSNAVILEVN